MMKEYRIGMAVAEFNYEVTSLMMERAKAEADFLGVSIVKTIKVPGAFEIPMAVKKLLEQDDIDGSLLMADLNGGAIGQYKPAKAYHYKRTGSTATAQFQMTHNGHLRCVKVTFTEDAAGVWAQTAAKSYYVHSNDSGALKIGVDVDTDPQTVEWSMTTSPSGSGMCISNMRGAGDATHSATPRAISSPSFAAIRSP